MTTKSKINSAVRICSILFNFAKKDMTIDEMLNFLEKQNIYSVETIYKYLNTINVSDFKIEKINNIYKLKKIPPYILFSDEELLGLSLLSKYEFPDKNIEENLQKFMSSLEKHLTSEIKDSLQKIKYINQKNNIIEKKQELIKKLNAYKNELITVKIKLKNGEIHNGVPKSLEIISNKIIFKIYEPSKFYDIDIDDIEEIEQLTKKHSIFNQSSLICFILKDNLAKSYKLKAGESVIEKKQDGSIVIKSTQEAENTLLKRLIRYGKYCEVKSPIDTRLKMIKMIEEACSFYQNIE